MAKKVGMALLIAVVAVSSSGCGGSGGIFYRAWKHFEWHLLGAYKDLVELHKEIDRYVFNLDERNPDRY